MLRGKPAAHVWRSVLETPNPLLPSSSSTAGKIPIAGPATYHGQGRDKSSTISHVPSREERRRVEQVVGLEHELGPHDQRLAEPVRGVLGGDLVAVLVAQRVVERAPVPDDDVGVR